MSQSEIVHLDSYRDRRHARFRRTLALHSRDPEQSRVLLQLWRALSTVGGDRAAVVWLDEYGPGLAHPHTLLDLASDRPRRFFSPRPLRAAWDTGVPSLLDIGSGAVRSGGGRDGATNASIIALGSDGPRSWFLVVDSLTPRAALSARVSGQLMFIAGEISSIVLHQDLTTRKDAGAGFEKAPGSFNGWPILQDIEGRRRDDEASQRIANRFLVARLVRGLMEDDFTVDQESLGHQVDGIRTELGPLTGGDPESRSWARVLAAVEGADHGELLAAALEWGKIVEGFGHLHGAQEILGMAYELAKVTGGTTAAADAARFQGKVHRMRAEWDDAISWYGLARRVAEELGDSRKLAVVLDGFANTYRDRGNLPQARELLLEVMELGQENGDRYALAIASHDLMTVEKLCGNLSEAIHYGWTAVQSYDSRDGSLNALFDLGGVLRETGELSAARDAYTVVAEQVNGFEYRMLALDALALIAAQRGEPETYRRLKERMDVEGWEDLSPVYRGQVLFFTGLSNRALGRETACRRWLKEGLAFAEEHGLNKLVFDIEEALEEKGANTPVPATVPASPNLTGQEIVGVRRGLKSLRETLAGAV